MNIGNRHIDVPAVCRNLGTKVLIGRPGLSVHENEAETTHVESLLVPRLDEGSIPSNSTGKIVIGITMTIFFKNANLFL